MANTNTTSVTAATRSARQSSLLDSDDAIYGTSDHDVIIGDDNDNAIYGLFGNDRLSGGAGNDYLDGGEGSDVLDGGTGNDTLEGGQSTDFLNGGAGNDVLHGGADNDFLSGGQGADVLDGGDGFDEAEYSNSTAAVQVNLATGTATGGDAQGDTLTGVEAVSGSRFNDLLTGDAASNRLSGGIGNDTLRGGAGDDLLYGDVGNDTLDGGQGNDFMEGGLGNDTLIGGAGSDMLNGGDGLDTADYTLSSAGVTVNLATGTGTGGDAQGDTLMGIEVVNGSAFADTFTSGIGATTFNGMDGNDTFHISAATRVDGGSGFDTVIYDQATAGVSVNMSSWGVLNGVEKVVGTSFNDYITGSSNADQIFGGAGNDTLNGFGGPGQDGGDLLDGGAGNDILQGWAGDDTLIGGSGDDLLVGGEGADMLNGGDGYDTVYYSGSSEGVTVNLDLNQGMGGEAGGDRFVSIEAVNGSSFNDFITGSSGADYLYGDAGNDTLNGFGGPGVDGGDTLIGGEGNDILQGWAGDDTLIGGNDDDLLVGGTGNDLISGGNGSDTIFFGRGDGVDTVVQSDTFDGTETTDAISFEGNIAFDQLWFRQDGNNLVVDVIGEANSSMILADWYAMDPANRIDEFQMRDGSGHTLSAAHVQMLVDAMACYSPPAAGEFTLSPELLESLQPTLAAAWA